MTEYISCPFCGEKDFDKVGLKHHIEEHCEIYKSTLTIEEERALNSLRLARIEEERKRVIDE